MSNEPTMEEVTALAKRRGFIYPNSEIYGGLVGVYDYGPYGVALANNIKAAWWHAMVQCEDTIVGLDASIFMRPEVWVASGHVGGFSDPMVECKECHARFRADHLIENAGGFADEKMSTEDLNSVFDEYRNTIACLTCGGKNFTEAKQFNLLVQSNLGNFADDWTKDPTYLRGETCQGIYVNYKNVLDTTRVKLPFGIAQIGKAFRNEIAPRQYIFRKREFEQMEMQMFTAPEDEMDVYEIWRQKRMEYYLDLGFKKKNVRWHEHENLVFYAKAAWDIEYKYPFGFKELEGVHARGDYDLSQHQKHSGVKLTYRDERSGKEFIPHIVETSVGVERTFLAALVDFYDVDELGGETRTVLRFPYRLAPIKAAVFPLLKNKPDLVQKARELYDSLKREVPCEFDDNGNIGKRYRRQDEIGTPYCITIDFETLENNSVTIRQRDTGKQERIAFASVAAAVRK